MWKRLVAESEFGKIFISEMKAEFSSKEIIQICHFYSERDKKYHWGFLKTI